MDPVGGEQDGGDVDEREAEEAKADWRFRVPDRPHRLEAPHHLLWATSVRVRVRECEREPDSKLRMISCRQRVRVCVCVRERD